MMPGSFQTFGPTLGGVTDPRRAREQGVHNLVVDLSKTPSMTSIGIRALTVIYKLFSQDGSRHLKLASVRPEIGEMLEIAGVSQYIAISPAVEEAVQSFS